MSILKASTDIITNIPVYPIGLATILVIMSVSTFKTAVILYLYMINISYSLIIFTYPVIALQILL